MKSINKSTITLGAVVALATLGTMYLAKNNKALTSKLTSKIKTFLDNAE